MRMFRPKVAAKEYLAKVLDLKSRAYTSQSMYQQHLYGLTGKLGGKAVVAYLDNEGYNILTIEDAETGKKTEVPYVYTPMLQSTEYNGVSTLLWQDADKSYNTPAGEKLTARTDPDYAGLPSTSANMS